MKIKSAIMITQLQHFSTEQEAHSVKVTKWYTIHSNKNVKVTKDGNES